MTPLRWPVVALLAAVLAFAELVLPELASAEQKAPMSAGVLRLDAPARMAAGESAPIVVRTTAASGSLPVVVRVGMTTHRFPVDIAEGRARLELGPPLTEQAGIIEVRAGSHTGTIEVAPGRAVGEFPVLAGPHTVVADGADRAVAVAIPRDRWGNPVAAGTEVRFAWEQPGPATGGAVARMDRSLAWVAMGSGTEAGRTRFTATTETSPGGEALIFEVPGPAARLAVEPVDVESPETGDALSLRTGPVEDRFGNTLPDGVQGHFRIGTVDGVHIVPGVVQGGRLRAWWVPESGPITIGATVNGVSSPTLAVTLPGGQP